MTAFNCKAEEKTFAAEGISSTVLIKMKKVPEAFLGSTDVGVISGLNVMRIINEPRLLPLLTVSTRRLPVLPCTMSSDHKRTASQSEYTRYNLQCKKHHMSDKGYQALSTKKVKDTSGYANKKDRALRE
nr:heat shock cognate 70 kDa protein 2 [Tanacetum cinerariifolium]